MTHKEAVITLLERMADELVCEVHHYAEYLYEKSQQARWSETSLAHLAARYGADEVAYTPDDLMR